MLRAVAWIIAWGSLLFLIPAHAQKASQQPGQQAAKRSSFQLETGKACEGISTAECCEQKIEMAGLRAQGDYLPRLIKTTVRLACEDAEKVVTPQVCKSIALGRGFGAREAEDLCKPAAKSCRKDGACSECVQELNRLAYQGSHHACHAVTYVPDKSGTKTVIIRTGGEPDQDTRFEITRKRTVVR